MKHALLLTLLIALIALSAATPAAWAAKKTSHIQGKTILIDAENKALDLYRKGYSVEEAYNKLWPILGNRLIAYAEKFAAAHGAQLSRREAAALAEIILYSILEDAYRTHLHATLRARYGEPRILVTKPVELGRNGAYTILYTPIPSDTPYPIHYWAQVTYDVDGGSGTDDEGNSFNVNGGNGLYQIVIYIYGDTTVVYELHFHDEDHPNPVLDRIYDAWRKIWYGRTEDIEHFTVENGNIEFNGIYDNGHTYAHFTGQHGTATRTYTPWTTIYVSNVWNHAMDTSDKNPSLPEYTYWT